MHNKLLAKFTSVAPRPRTTRGTTQKVQTVEFFFNNYEFCTTIQIISALKLCKLKICTQVTITQATHWFCLNIRERVRLLSIVSGSYWM